MNESTKTCNATGLETEKPKQHFVPSVYGDSPVGMELSM